MPFFHDYQFTSYDHLVEDVMVERKTEINASVITLKRGVRLSQFRKTRVR